MLRDVQPAEAGLLAIDGKTVVDFASNDYLGLSQNRGMIERANEWADRHGAGSRSSRLVVGNLQCLTGIEQKIARLKGSEAALIMGAGFQANSTVLATLLDRKLQSGDGAIRLFSDRLCHASTHFGVAASGVKQHRFRHNDLTHLETILNKNVAGNDTVLIVTESVFSMDGDRLDVESIRRLADQSDAMLYVDEAHATGLYGENGLGLMSGGFRKDDVVLGTFGKAFGCYGSYIACSATTRDYLINRCGGLIYSTALPPWVLGAIDWALDVVPGMHRQREHLQQLSQTLRNRLGSMNLTTLNSDTQIVPVVIGDDQQVMNIASRLQDDGFLVGAIRPPTVPPGSARLRISVSAAHTADQVDALIASLGNHLPVGAAP